MTPSTSALSKQRYPWVTPVALASSLSAIVIFGGSTFVAELMTPGFDPVRQTISELAAGDAPTRIFVTIAFVLTGACHMLTASFTPGIGVPGRVVLFAAGICTELVAAFPLPTVASTSTAHRFAAMLGFVLLAIWPALGMRVDKSLPFLFRPWGAIASTLFIAVFCFTFLGVWASASQPAVGVWERLAADIEGVWPAVVVLILWFAQRRRRASTPAE
ncbi:MAG: DUF998 domain-containing protein [Gammaproteobacteria bacterium]|nr:DUF998 domain-containing protein [Gammaproteobacteria bacterium]